MPPEVEKKSQLMSIKKHQKYILQPILSSTGKLVAVIYVIAPLKPGQKQHKPLTNTDIHMVICMARFFEISLNLIHAKTQRSLTEKQCITTLDIADKICQQKTLFDVCKAVQSSLPEFLSFKKSFLLLRNPHTDSLYSVAEDYTLTRDELAIFDVIDEKLANNLPLTEKERTKNLERKMRPGTIYHYPCSVGITGYVFKHKKAM